MLVHSLTLGEIARITGGELHGDADVMVTSISTDTRDIDNGALFAAIVGQRSDAHNFVSDAITSGATAVLSSRVVDAPCVVVSNRTELDPVINALGKIAEHERSLLTGVNVIGVTGSSGKTSTKDIIGQVLSQHASTCAPAGSPNNELGLPMTILNTPAKTKNIVLEMGMRGIGHIQYLCDIADPTIGVVTNVGQAHVGEVGSIDDIARAKAELVESLPNNGIAILNADDQRVLAMKGRTQAHVVTFGVNDSAHVRATDVKVLSDGTTTFTAVVAGKEHDVVLPLIGAHNVSNALAAIAVGLATGMTLEECAQALETVELKSKWRMERHDLARGIVLINDAYNANPDSMKAAIEALSALTHAHKKWLVIAGMHELGPASVDLHRMVGQQALEHGIDHVVVIGDTAQPAADVAGERAVWVPDRNAACDYIEKNLADNDAVLIKASRSEGLEVLAQELEKRIGRTTA